MNRAKNRGLPSTSSAFARMPMYGSGPLFSADATPRRPPLRRALAKTKAEGSTSTSVSGGTELLYPPWPIHFFPIGPGVEISSVVWWELAAQQPYRGAIGDGTPIYVEPYSALKIACSFVSLPSATGRLFAWIGDNTTGLATIEVTTVPLISHATISLADWANPWPQSLYGHHQLWVEFWELTDQGAPLPPAYQAAAGNDARLYKNVSSDWSWVVVSPGCKNSTAPGSMGIDFVTLNSMSMSFSNSPVLLDPTGKYVAEGQTATLKWDISSADLPPTTYGYSGSFSGINVGYWLGQSWHVAGPEKNGVFTFPIGGLPWAIQANIVPYFSVVVATGTECEFIARTYTLNAKSNSPPAQKLPDLIVQNIYIADADGDAFIPGEGEQFTIVYVIANAGTAPAGSFSVYLELDDGATQPQTVGCDPIPLGQYDIVTWTLNDGLSDGVYTTSITVDSANQVQESNESNNFSTYTFSVVG